MNKRYLLVILLLVLTNANFGQSSKFIETDQIKIHYLEWGNSDETIILLHGLYDSSEKWKMFAPLLAEKYRVIAPDRRGLGLSQKTADGYDIQNLAKDLNLLAEKLKIKKFHLVGHSAGGNIAMNFAANKPKKLKSLILIEGGYWKKRKPGKINECPKPVERQCLINKIATIENYKYDAERFYAKISTPTLLILAIPSILEKSPDQTKMMFQTMKQEVENTAIKRFANAKFQTIMDSGHWIQEDQPEELSRAILDFIKKKGFVA